jgi:uncharacterized integral membrane protein (TIGR00698 family)
LKLAKEALFVACGLAVLHPWFSSAEALLLGVAFALALGNPFAALTKKWTSKLLMLSVVLLGFGIDLLVVGRVGLAGVGYTVVTIAFALGMGLLLGRLFGVSRDLSVLISCGTAICGGSAIAAVSSAIKPRNDDVTMSLAVVFLLNAAALFIFPSIGHYFGLSPSQFGLWAALAVHDTSSVLGTAQAFGGEALQVGTTVKLARALWITPLTLAVSFVYARLRSGEGGQGKITIPWFIFGFIAASAFVTFAPGMRELGHQVAWIGVRSLVFVLFLIGSNLARSTLARVGARPLAQGLLLWILVGSTTLFAIHSGFLTH